MRHRSLLFGMLIWGLASFAACGGSGSSGGSGSGTGSNAGTALEVAPTLEAGWTPIFW